MLPKKIQKNQLITADLLNNIIDSIRECQINSGVGYSFSRNAGGTTLSIQKSVARGGEAIELTYPFQYFSGGSPSSAWFGLRAGTINGVLPTNWTTTFSLPSSFPYTRYINLNCQSDGKQVVAADISLETNPPSPVPCEMNFAPAEFSINTHVVVNHVAYRTIGSSSILAMTQETIRTEKVVASYGTMPYDIWYTWVFAS